MERDRTIFLLNTQGLITLTFYLLGYLFTNGRSLSDFDGLNFFIGYVLGAVVGLLIQRTLEQRR